MELAAIIFQCSSASYSPYQGLSAVQQHMAY